MNNHDQTLLALAVTKALAMAENGGVMPTRDKIKAGKTGELKSVYQFTPATWKRYAKEELGDSNIELNPDNETKVVASRVKKWLGKGFSPPQIASMWNAGESEPNAHTGKYSDGSPSIGINKKYGVKFDVPSYAHRVDGYTKDTYKKLLGSIPPSSSRLVGSSLGEQNPPEQISNNEAYPKP